MVIFIPIGSVIYHMADRIFSTQGLVGAVIVILGVLLLLDTTNVYDTGPLFRYTPVLFILVGVYAMVVSNFRNLIGPLALILVAGAVQLVTLDVVEWEDLNVLWPLLIVLFGLALLTGRFRRTPAATERSFVDAFALFGANEQRAVGADFEGASLTALFGGVTLDLRDVDPTDQPIEVSVLAMFGGVDLVVPRNWNVDLDVLPVLGGASDERLRGDEVHDTVDLVVTGTVAFGGVTLKD